MIFKWDNDKVEGNDVGKMLYYSKEYLFFWILSNNYNWSKNDN